MSNKKTSPDREVRRSRRAYKDPTADMAIANVMREERRKKRQEQIATRSSFRGGGGHEEK